MCRPRVSRYFSERLYICMCGAAVSENFCQETGIIRQLQTDWLRACVPCNNLAVLCGWQAERCILPGNNYEKWGVSGVSQSHSKHQPPAAPATAAQQTAPLKLLFNLFISFAPVGAGKTTPSGCGNSGQPPATNQASNVACLLHWQATLTQHSHSLARSQSHTACT